MKTVTKEQLVSILQSLGIQAGDGLLVHSAIQFLGKPENGLKTYFDAICVVAGIVANSPLPLGEGLGVRGDALTEGTLAVPTFNFAFARGEPFDPLNTPAEGMGVFSEYVRQQPGARRTRHPMQSLAVVGRYAEDLAQRDTPSAFDPGSAFDRMLELDFKLLLLGADIQAVSLLHYNEQHLPVPYRYWKDFQGRVRIYPPSPLSLEGRGARGEGDTAAIWEERTYRMFVRDMEMDAHLTLHPVQPVLEARGQWRSASLNYGKISIFRMRDLVLAVDEFLKADPWSLVINREHVLAVYQARQNPFS